MLKYPHNIKNGTTFVVSTLTTKVITMAASSDVEIGQYVASCLVYNALEMNILQVEDILGYLISAQVNDNTLVAYRHLLLRVSGDRHYYKDTHFLARAAPEYGAIYAMSNQATTIRPRPDGDEMEAGMFYYKGVLLMQQQANLAHRIKIITDQTNIRLQPGDISLVVKARSEKLLSVIATRLSQNIFNAAVEVDWIEKIERYYFPEKLSNILTNFRQRSNLLPLYWQKIAPRCQDFLKKIFTAGRILPDRDLPTKIKSLFPDFFPAITNAFTEKAWFIYQLPAYLQGYVLGYPIHEKNPSRDELNCALQTLSIIGVEQYTSNYEEKHKAILCGTPGSNLGFSPINVIVVNESNTLEESSFSYSALDAISFDVGNKRYIFTRPEFKTLTEKGRNPWTNLDLPFEDIALISAREALAQVFLLPSPVPLKDLLNNIETYIPRLTGGSRVYLQDPDAASQEAAIEAEFGMSLQDALNVAPIPPQLGQAILAQFGITP